MADPEGALIQPGAMPESGGKLDQVFDLKPRNLTEAMEFAKLMAKSELVPKEYQGKPANIIVAVQHGAEFGLSPLQSLSSIAVINGRPTMWGDAVLGVVQASGHLDSITERTPDEALKAGEGSCTVRRKGKEPLTRTFSVDDANRANLIQRSGPTGPWSTYRGRMLQMRARSWALRDAFPDVLRGLHIREEQEDVPRDVEFTIKRPKARVEAGQVDKLLAEGGPTATTPASQGPAATPPQATNGTAWRGKLASVETKAGVTKDKKTGKDKPYTLYTVVGADGWRGATFSDSDADIARSIIKAGDEAEISYEQGQYGPKIKTIQPIAFDGPTEDEPGGNG